MKVEKKSGAIVVVEPVNPYGEFHSGFKTSERTSFCITYPSHKMTCDVPPSSLDQTHLVN